jgi:CarD family transcriptional regulator
MTFKANDIVLYAMQLVCVIAEISKRDFNGNTDEYYILKPVFNSTSTIYIPVSSEMLSAKLRHLLSAEEIYSLVESKADESITIDSDDDRRERYREILSRGDRAELVSLIKTLHPRQEAQKERGKKLCDTDSQFIKDVVKMLYEEFSYILNIKREQIIPLILGTQDFISSVRTADCRQEISHISHV